MKIRVMWEFGDSSVAALMLPLSFRHHPFSKSLQDCIFFQDFLKLEGCFQDLLAAVRSNVLNRECDTWVISDTV